MSVVRKAIELHSEVIDAVIVGSGPSGAVVAKRLVEAGMSVVCLEQGDWLDYSSARADHADYELTATTLWEHDPNLRKGPGDYPLDTSESDIDAVMWAGVGGASMIYAAAWNRSRPSDFRVRSIDGVADDWPISYEELSPYYTRVERDFAVSGFGGDPAYPGASDPPLPPAPIGAMGERLAMGHEKLGWHWWPGTNAIATRDYGPLRACRGRGTCMRGCMEKAKASTDLTHWPELIARGASLITGARVTEVELGPDGCASGVIYVDRDGIEQRQRAAVTILAANAIGTPRILLSSATPDHPQGLANSSGLVGARLMMHPFASVVGLFADELGTYRGVWGQSGYSLEFYETHDSRDFVRGAKWQLSPTGGPLSCLGTFPWGGDEIWGNSFHQQVRARMSRSALWGIIGEDLPDEANRVELSDKVGWADGAAGVKITYRTSENSKRLLEFHCARASESMRAAGAYEVLIAPLPRATGWHLLGTARMGVDPATSVVDDAGACHDVPNLFVVDGSIWPTSSGMNPTATIAAVALRCADQLVAGRRDVRMPA